MGTLLGSSALLLGALQAQQKLTKKGPSRALFVLKPKSLGQSRLNSSGAVLIVAMRQPCWVDDSIGIENELCNKHHD